MFLVKFQIARDHSTLWLVIWFCMALNAVYIHMHWCSHMHIAV